MQRYLICSSHSLHESFMVAIPRQSYVGADFIDRNGRDPEQRRHLPTPYRTLSTVIDQNLTNLWLSIRSKLQYSTGLIVVARGWR